MSEQITHYTPCCATCRHAEAEDSAHGGTTMPTATAAPLGVVITSRGSAMTRHIPWRVEITVEPHGSMEEHTALCEQQE